MTNNVQIWRKIARIFNPTLESNAIIVREAITGSGTHLIRDSIIGDFDAMLEVNLIVLMIKFIFRNWRVKDRMFDSGLMLMIARMLKFVTSAVKLELVLFHLTMFTSFSTSLGKI